MDPVQSLWRFQNLIWNGLKLYHLISQTMQSAKSLDIDLDKNLISIQMIIVVVMMTIKKLVSMEIMIQLTLPVCLNRFHWD